jgi:hypothetical protein
MDAKAQVTELPVDWSGGKETAFDKSFSLVYACQSQIVELKFFKSLTLNETAQFLKISPNTLRCEWNITKA